MLALLLELVLVGSVLRRSHNLNFLILVGSQMLLLGFGLFWIGLGIWCISFLVVLGLLWWLLGLLQIVLLFLSLGYLAFEIVFLLLFLGGLFL